MLHVISDAWYIEPVLCFYKGETQEKQTVSIMNPFEMNG